MIHEIIYGSYVLRYNDSHVVIKEILCSNWRRRENLYDNVMKCKYLMHKIDHRFTIPAFNGEGSGLLFVGQFTRDTVASQKCRRGGGQHTVCVYPHPSS